jgi:hypothetical protein
MSMRSRTLRAQLLRLSRRTARLVLGHGRMAADQRVEMASRFRALIWRRAACAAGRPASIAGWKPGPTYILNSDVRMSWALNLWLRWTKNERIPAPSGNGERPQRITLLHVGAGSRLRAAATPSRAGALRSRSAAATVQWPGGAARRTPKAPPVLIDRHSAAPMRPMMMRITSNARRFARESIGGGRSALKFSNAGTSTRDMAAIQRPAALMAPRAMTWGRRSLATAVAEAPGGFAPLLRRMLPSRAAAASRHHAAAAVADSFPVLAQSPALRYAAPKKAREEGAVSAVASLAPDAQSTPEMRTSGIAAQRSAAAFSLDSAATERLTDEIIRRVDRRIRIERERCGR